MSETKFWLPPLSPKQFEIFNSTSKYLLISGPRRTGKTLGLCHRLLKHLYDIPKARVFVISKVLKIALQGGIWSDLIDTVYPIWNDAGITQFSTQPKLDATRSPFFGIKNRYGGESHCYLNSCEHDSEAERLLKGRRASMVVINEGSHFDSRKLFDAAREVLRMPGVPYEQQHVIIDSNPASSGPAHWLYRLFYQYRTQEKPDDGITDDEQISQFRQFQNELGLIEIMIPDNPFLTRQEISGLIEAYRYDPSLMKRYIEGKWEIASTEGFFHDVFRYEAHVLGNILYPNKSDWEILLPEESTSELMLGYDLGSMWSFIVLISKSINEKGQNVFSVLDEISVENEMVGLDNIADAVVAMMDKWESFLGRKVLWRHWSDQSAFQHNITVRNTEAMTLYTMSKGRINLLPAEKYKGSVMDGINMIRRLLFENRIMISAQCTKLIEGIRGLRPQLSRGTGVVKVAETPARHPIDALKYALISEEPRDIARKMPRVSTFKAPVISLG